MKKLLTSAAVCGLVFAAAPAHADIDLELGGYMKGYVVFADSDEDTAATDEVRNLDIIRDTELHVTGETTLDNGLTVGFHLETEVDADGETANAQESYAYFSGGWGRVNFGAEDGAAYLLQVDAPSADSNIDGIRQYVNPHNYTTTTDPGATLATLNVATLGLDYAQDVSGYDDKITYLSPILNGLQLGFSYTPDTADASASDAAELDEVDDVFGAVFEGAVRYEGSFNNVGYTLGAGYTNVDLEETVAIAVTDFNDDREVFNVGADFDIGAFGFGISYKEDNFGEVVVATTPTEARDDEETLVLGVDYTTGPFKLGASYMDVDNTRNIAGNVGTTNGINTDRYAGGVTYTYGPGMTFRGSLQYVEHDNVTGLTTGDSVESTAIVLGTQINF